MGSRVKMTAIQEMLSRLRKAWPDATCTLDYSNPLELLVATILSAQCTDERVNALTKTLFKKYRSARDYATSKSAELEHDIRPSGFFRNKAKSIQGACRKIWEEHEGKVPDSMEALLTLPGVARKTANVVLGNAFQIPSGIVVDTHVSRVSQRLGLTKNTRPEKIERDLMEMVPGEEWISFGHRMILHGRHLCMARKPLCGSCPLNTLCPSAFKV